MLRILSLCAWILVFFTNVHAQVSTIFLNQKDGEALARRNLSACQSIDCKAILLRNSTICESKDCIGMINLEELWCLSWDCQVLVYASKNSFENISSLCLSPNCRAILDRNISFAGDFNRTLMRSSDGEGLSSLLVQWHLSGQASFWDFFNTYIQTRSANIEQRMRQIPPVRIDCRQDLN